MWNPFSVFKKKKKNIDEFKNKKKWNIINVVFCSIFAVCTLGGTATSAWYVTTNQQLGAEFNNSYNFKIELDTTHPDGDPLKTVSLEGSDKDKNIEDFKVRTQATADAFAKYLYSQNINQYNVFPSFYVGNDNKAHASISVQIPKSYTEMIKTISSEDTKKIALDKWNSYINTVYSSNVTLLFNWNGVANTNQGQESNHQVNKTYSVLPQEALVGDAKNSKNTVFKDPTNPKSVYIKCPDSFKNLTKYFEWAKNNKDGEKFKNFPLLYVIRDQASLINRMSYVLNCAALYWSWNINKDNEKLVSSGAAKDYEDYIKLNGRETNFPFKYLSPSEKDFATKWILGANGNIEANSAINLNDVNNYIYGSADAGAANNIVNFTPWLTIQELLEKSSYNPDIDIVGSQITNELTPYNLLSYIDAKEFATPTSQTALNYGKIATPKDSNMLHSGVVSFEFINKYVLEIITPDNYTTYFPKIEPGKKDDSGRDDVGKFFSISAPSIASANDLYNALTSYGLNHELLAFKTFSPVASGELAINFFQHSIYDTNKTFVENLFRIDPLLGAAIALILIVLIIGIIVSVLYRVPGAAFTLLVSAISGATLCILIVSGYVLSFSILSSILVGIFLNFFAFKYLIEKIKKHYLNHSILEVALKKGFKTSVMQIIDAFIVILLMCVGMIYFGNLDLQHFGVSLIIFTALSILSFLLLLVPSCFAFLKLTKWNIKCLFMPKALKMHGTKFQYSVGENKKFETSFSNLKMFNKFSWKITDFKTKLIGLILLVALIIGMVLLFTIGVHNSYFIYGGTKVLISANAANHAGIIDAIKNLNLGFGNAILDNNFYIMYSSKIINVATDFAGLKDYINIGNVVVQNISTIANIQIILDCVKMIFIISGLIAAYSIIRNGFVTLIPLFLSLLIAPLLTVAFISILQITIDSYVIISVSMIYMFNAFFSITFINNIYNKWMKNHFYHKKDLILIIATELKNSLHFFLGYSLVLIGSLIVLMLLSSTTLIPLYALILTGVVLINVCMYTVIPEIIYLFIKIKYKYYRIIEENKIKKINYDKIDEQNIDNINFFENKKYDL